MKAIAKVYVLPNGKSLEAKEFNRYFEKKVLYTIRKFSMSRQVKIKKSNDFNSLVLKFLMNKFGFLNEKSKTWALDNSTDDIASEVLESWFVNKQLHLIPSTKKEIMPLFLITDEEIKIYASLKNLSGKDKKKTQARTLLDEMEKKHPEIKRAIVQSYLQILEKPK